MLGALLSRTRRRVRVPASFEKMPNRIVILVADVAPVERQCWSNRVEFTGVCAVARELLCCQLRPSQFKALGTF